MKILILANNDGGLYHFRKELLERLIAEKHEVYVSVPKGAFFIELQQIGTTIIDTYISRRGTNPLEDLKLLKKYCSVIDSVKPNIVFTYTIKPNIYGGIACSLKGVPYIANVTGLGTAVEHKSLLQLITLSLYKFAFRSIQTVFFQNTDNEKFFTDKGIALGKHKMLPGSGVNLKRFSSLEYPDDSSAEFVFIARIMKEKGIDQYLDAAEYITSKYHSTKFHVCGFCEPEYAGRLDELVKNGVVNYHGMVKDVREVLKFTHCTIHPTYYPEGMSNVLLESSASARPIITTNRAGCREVIDEGVNGFICKQQDSKDLISKIEKFLSFSWEEKRKMGLAGRQKVEKEFDRNIVVEKYLKELERVKNELQENNSI